MKRNSKCGCRKTILRDKKVLFVWIPKTGGTSIYHVLEKHGGKKLRWPQELKSFKNTGIVTFGHYNIIGLHKAGVINKDFFDNAYKFAVVRNPWDRMVSLYFYLKKLKYIPEDSPFSWFCKRVKSGISPTWRMGRKDLSIANQQSAWVYHSGKSTVDDVARFETLDRDVGRIFAKIGIYEPLPVLNKGRHNDYRQYYDSETQNIVGDIYSDDVNNFNYIF